ncbi:IS3 family transposase [Erysipelothrix rhusiopathiae]|uniref:IS3 family transposase n=1 Tax=Erysipelothrix rhusiopathiae TaxID=1648 RepID=UPI001C1F55DE|nr:IS3 family transposase [Erysipelothrix rhusiopathiae]
MAKLTRKQIIEIYEKRKLGQSVCSLVNEYGINKSSIKYLVRLIDQHGPNVLRRNKSHFYSHEFKLEVINRIIMDGESTIAVAIELGLSSDGLIYNWIKNYKENGYNVIERKRGKPSMTKPTKLLTVNDELKALKKKNKYLEAENEYLKKMNAVVKQRVEREKKKTRVVSLLRQKYPLEILLKISGLARSTYYFYVSKIDFDTKNDELMQEIIEIYYDHKGRYSYRRITLELNNRGIRVNHKKVLRLMNKMGLHSIIRKKRKYSSYKGTVGTIVENRVQRDFEVDKPNQKWFTDITEFNVQGQKIYLSPILDAYGRYIVSYNISTSPNLDQTRDMLHKAFSCNDTQGTIIHSDRGWQYQHQFYVKELEAHSMIRSMSRKGNSIDNGLMEGFFGLLKSEMYYDQEHKYKKVEELVDAIDEYIDYYNNKRIKSKLKGLTPVQYRNQSLNLKDN